MYERIKVEQISEGSSTLPSILQISQQTAYQVGVQSSSNKNNVSNAYIGANAFENNRFKYSSLGQNTVEFSIDFQCPEEQYTDNVKKLHDLILANEYITINKSFITDNFKVIQINDYSYQAMTMNNYDYFFKLFDSNKQKITSRAIVIIKSFTTKKAWVLIDNTLNISSFTNYYYIIDFTYKFFKNESDSKYRFQALNNYSNLQSLFNDTQNASPYFDKYYIQDYSKTYQVLNLQDTYLLQSLLDNYDTQDSNKDLLATQFNYKPIENIHYSILREPTKSYIEDSLANTLTKFDIIYTTDPTQYLKSAAYEVYKYDIDSNVGQRVINPTSGGTYEVYPVMSDLIHYIFKIPNNTSASDITVANIKQAMYKAGLYLYNYNFTNFNVFQDTNTYIDVYIQLPYGKVNLDTTTEFSADTTPVLTIDFADLDNDYRSKYDPTSCGQLSYPINIDKDYYIAYNGADSYLKGLLTDYVIRVYSTAIEKIDISRANVYDTYFDILSTNPTTDNADNKINSTNLIAGFKTVGCRASDNADVITLNNHMSNIVKKNNILCKNLSKLMLPITTDYEDIPGVVQKITDRQVDMIDCFFVYFESTRSYVDIETKYVISGVDKIITQRYMPYEAGKYIIPSEVNLKSISTDSDLIFYKYF